jgi:aminoglycoside phosphotransferase (APT) family kinase protein
MTEPPSANATPGQAVLIPVLDNHRFDEAALVRYLAAHLPEFHRGCSIRQFQGGFSNPTFHLQTPEGDFVLRKQPPGVLLPSAHAVDREYKVLKALWDTDIPVPRARLLCEDRSVIGTTFYVMDYVEGRVYADRTMVGVAAADRRAMYDDMCRVLGLLHGLDYRALGLEQFGKPAAYAARQVARWSKQYAASAVAPCPAMDRLLAWLPEHIPAEDEAAISHGDYRVGNLLFHPNEPRVVAVLDWELATIGHPIADLAYCCMAYHLPEAGGRGLVGLDLEALGIPTEAEYLDNYRRRTSRDHIPHYKFFMVFSLFRIAAILAGVYKRSLDGQAVDARMAEAKRSYQEIAARACELL